MQNQSETPKRNGRPKKRGYRGKKLKFVNEETKKLMSAADENVVDDVPKMSDLKELPDISSAPLDITCDNNFMTADRLLGTPGKKYTNTLSRKLDNTFEKGETLIQREEQNFGIGFHIAPLMLTNSRNINKPLGFKNEGVNVFCLIQLFEFYILYLNCVNT